ncbi:MAG: glycosyltransferase [bacterium]|nr:glycosyltransferase [bacterium]
MTRTTADPTRVLHVTGGIDPSVGGPAVALDGLARAQAAQGLSVSIVSGWREGTDLGIVERLGQAGVGVTLVGPCRGPSGWHPATRGVLARAVPEADIVHIHQLWESPQHHAAVRARATGRPYILRTCGHLAPWSLAQSRWKKRLYLALRLRGHIRAAAAMHFTTDAEAEESRPEAGQAESIVEPNGIQWDEFGELPDAAEFRRRFPEAGDRPLVLFLSRLHPKKGIEMLLPAFARAAPEPALLVIAGPSDSDYRAGLERTAREIGLENRVLFTGMLRGRDRLLAYRAADLFVLPSYHENFGIVVVEALACGTPVLVSDAVGIQDEIVRAGVGGVVRPETAAVARGLEAWLAEPAKLRAAGERAREFARERYDWESIARRWTAHYDRLIPES